MSKTVAKILGVLIGGLLGYLVAEIYDRYWLFPFEEKLELLKSAPGIIYTEMYLELIRGEFERFKLFKIVKLIILGLGLVLGYLLSGLLRVRIEKTLEGLLELLQNTSKERILAGILGFATGIAVTFVIILPLYAFMKDATVNIFQDPIVRIGLYLVLMVWLGYFGSYLAVNVFYPEKKADQLGAEFGIKGIPPKIIDTSAIIDGRIAEVVKTHFLEGVLVIPESVLRELQNIADSSDHLRRAKGRRGLEILNELRSNPKFPLKIYDDSEEEAVSTSVDEQIIRIAKKLGGIVMTNDYNLNKVATVQRVDVLNINELANAVKPMVVPNETLDVLVIKAGKEHGQGVGYLDDGTMVVIDEGAERIGEELTVKVTSVMQTAAGRLIFARVDGEAQ